MKKICVTGYSDAQVLTRHAVFKLLTGTTHFSRFRNAEDAVKDSYDAVFLNCDRNPGLAERDFSLLKDHNATILVYSDVKLHSLLVRRLGRYDKCSLIICPEVEELEDFRKSFLEGKMYHSIAARDTDYTSIPLPGYGFEQLTEQQEKIIFSLLRGDQLKVMAAEFCTSQKSVSLAVSRLRELFGNCTSNEELVANISGVL